LTHWRADKPRQQIHCAFHFRPPRLDAENPHAIILLEQRMVEAPESCDRGYLIESGKTLMPGTTNMLLADARVKQADLGL
jgi:ABC-type branched-subunit amino acid transport system ATPase component